MARSPKAIRREERLAVVLAMVAGYVDGFGLLTFRTYLSYMSGNTTQVGCNSVQGNLGLVVPSAVAIMSFVSGIFAGTLLGHASTRNSGRLALGGSGGLLVAVVFATQLRLLPDLVKIAGISLAMGIMNTALSSVGNEHLSLTFVTGTLSRFGKHLALWAMRVPLADSRGSWDTQLGRALLLACVWAGFLGGAMLGGIATPLLTEWTLLPPAIVLVVLAFLSLMQSRTENAGSALINRLPNWIIPASRPRRPGGTRKP